MEIRERLSYDWGMLTVVVTLLALGLLMVFSASFAQGLFGYEQPYRFIMRQLMWTTVGLGALLFAAHVPYTFWQQWSIPMMGLALLSLLAVMVVGSDLFGSTRTFLSGSVQPSEPVKIVIIIYISAWLASKGDRIRDVRVGLLPFSILMGAVTVFIVISVTIIITAGNNEHSRLF